MRAITTVGQPRRGDGGRARSGRGRRRRCRSARLGRGRVVDRRRRARRRLRRRRGRRRRRGGRCDGGGRHGRRLAHPGQARWLAHARRNGSVRGRGERCGWKRRDRAGAAGSLIDRSRKSSSGSRASRAQLNERATAERDWARATRSGDAGRRAQKSSTADDARAGDRLAQAPALTVPLSLLVSFETATRSQTRVRDVDSVAGGAD